MTFVDELKAISDSVELHHKLDRQLEEIKAKMHLSAKNGYRTFQIEIICLTDKTYFDIKHPTAENCCVLYLRADKYANTLSFYERKVIEFLNELGFTVANVEHARHRIGYNETVHFSMGW